MFPPFWVKEHSRIIMFSFVQFLLLGQENTGDSDLMENIIGMVCNLGFILDVKSEQWVMKIFHLLSTFHFSFFFPFTFPRPAISPCFISSLAFLSPPPLEIRPNAILLLELSLTLISARYPPATNIQAHINLCKNRLLSFCSLHSFLLLAGTLICLINPPPAAAPRPTWHQI